MWPAEDDPEPPDLDGRFASLAMSTPKEEEEAVSSTNLQSLKEKR